MTSDFTTPYGLPPLLDGRRYPHELQDPTPIPADIRRPVLELLHKFYLAVIDNAPTLSEASGTSVAARSEASVATSMTEMTSAFSANNGPVQRESAKKPLDEVQRARKALLRKLKACVEDCRKRKVKCPLWHHALRDLLKIEHTEHDEEVVEWAIRYDAELQTPTVTPPVSTRVTQFASGSDVEERNDVVAQANGAFNLGPGTPMPYGSGIYETAASLLGGPVGVSPQPFADQEILHQNPPGPITYSIFKNELMVLLGTRVVDVEPAHYSCWFDDCHVILPLQELIYHFHRHIPFERLDDPLRMVCPRCDTFYSYSTDECFACSILSGDLEEKVYGYFPNETTMSMHSESVAVQFGPSSSFGSPGTEGIGGYSYSGPSSAPWDPGYYSNNYGDGFSGCSGVGYYSYTKSAIVSAKRSFFKTAAALSRFSTPSIRRRKYLTTLLIVAVVSVFFGYRKHRWLLSNLVQLMRGVSMVSPSKLPLAGVVISSVAFALHRIIVHATRVNNIRSGWLSRCAISAFNVACGRRQTEELDTTGYELGHSRS